MRSPRADVVRTDIAHHGEDMMNPLHWVVMVGVAKGQFDIPITGSSGAAVVILAGVGVLSVIGLQKLERWLAPWREFAVRT